jgi:O-antigen/teichoic acid export membrane protein
MVEQPPRVENSIRSSTAAIEPLSGLLARVLQGSFWMLNSNLLGRAVNLARGIVLARLLVPGDFGLFGLASVVTGFTALFGDVGAGIFLVYSEAGIDEHADTAFWVNLGVAILLATSTLSMGPLVARIYHRPDLVPVLAVLAFSLFLQTATTVHRNLLRRELRFRALAMIDILMTLVGFAAGVSLAWWGYGVWSFVVSALLGNAASALLLFYVLGWVPRWRISADSVRKLALFSGWYLAQAVAWYLVLNVDNLMVGKFLGIDALGIYGLAYNYALLPITFVAGSLGTVVFAELPRLYSDATRFWAAYFRLSRLLAGIVCPMAAALVVVAPDIFPLLFGNKWNSAIVPFQILAVYGAVRCLWLDPFSSLGKFELSFWVGVGMFLFSGLAIYVALPFGQVGVAVAVLFAVGAAHLTSLYIVSRSLREWMRGFRNSAPYFLTAAFACAAAATVRHEFAASVSGRKELLVLVSLSTVFGIYGAVFRKELGEHLNLMLTKRVPRTYQHV